MSISVSISVSTLLPLAVPLCPSLSLTVTQSHAVPHCPLLSPGLKGAEKRSIDEILADESLRSDNRHVQVGWDL